MGLFNKFDNIYDTNISASQVCNMKVGSLPYGDYDSNGNLVGYYWHYGDTIELDIVITGEVVAENEELVNKNGDKTFFDINEYLRGKSVKVAIYNFRSNPILEKMGEIIEIENAEESTTKDAKSIIRIVIDEETSKKLLRGTYYLIATVVKENESIFIPLEGLDKQNCKITII